MVIKIDLGLEPKFQVKRDTLRYISGGHFWAERKRVFSQRDVIKKIFLSGLCLCVLRIPEEKLAVHNFWGWAISAREVGEVCVCVPTKQVFVGHKAHVLGFFLPILPISAIGFLANYFPLRGYKRNNRQDHEWSAFTGQLPKRIHLDIWLCWPKRCVDVSVTDKGFALSCNKWIAKAWETLLFR